MLRVIVLLAMAIVMVAGTSPLHRCYSTSNTFCEDFMFADVLSFGMGCTDPTDEWNFHCDCAYCDLFPNDGNANQWYQCCLKWFDEYSTKPCTIKKVKNYCKNPDPENREDVVCDTCPPAAASASIGDAKSIPENASYVTLVVCVSLVLSMVNILVFASHFFSRAPLSAKKAIAFESLAQASTTDEEL